MNNKKKLEKILYMMVRVTGITFWYSAISMFLNNNEDKLVFIIIMIFSFIVGFVSSKLQLKIKNS